MRKEKFEMVSMTKIVKDVLGEINDETQERIRRYATGNQNVNAYLKALGYPSQTKAQKKAHKKRVEELEALWNKLTGGEVIPSVIEWSCKGYLGKRL